MPFLPRQAFNGKHATAFALLIWSSKHGGKHLVVEDVCIGQLYLCKLEQVSSHQVRWHCLGFSGRATGRLEGLRTIKD